MKNMKVRAPMYVLGLFIMTMGIAVSVKSNLGVSPVSSIPYSITCIWGMEMGIATVVFHCGLVLLQFLLLRKNFKLINLLQIPVGVLFGLFTTLCNNLAAIFPTPENLAARGVMTVFSALLIAAGIFLYMPADIVPLAGEGAMAAVSQVTGVEFSKVKIAFDTSMVVISVIACLLLTHSLGSVGAGTIAAAFLVGFILGILNKTIGKYRDRILDASDVGADKTLPDGNCA